MPQNHNRRIHIFTKKRPDLFNHLKNTVYYTAVGLFVNVGFIPMFFLQKKRSNEHIQPYSHSANSIDKSDQDSKLSQEQRLGTRRPIANIAHHFFHHPADGYAQLELPSDPEEPWFARAMEEVVYRLSEFKKRPKESVISDLLSPDSD